MKTIFVFLCVLVSIPTVQAARFAEPLPILGTQSLFRGPQPIGHVDELKKMGIEEVVIIKNETKNEVTREKSELAAAGYSASAIYHIPLEWKDIDVNVACEQTMEALQVLVRAESEGRRAYLHCTVGEDRTGMVAGLASMLIAGTRADEVFENEMCARNYSNGNPGKPRDVTNAIEDGLTPLFWAVAEQIESGRLNANNLGPQACGKIRIDLKKRTRCN